MDGAIVVPAPKQMMTKDNTEEFTLPGKTCQPISLTGDSRTRFVRDSLSSEGYVISF